MLQKRFVSYTSGMSTNPEQWCAPERVTKEDKDRASVAAIENITEADLDELESQRVGANAGRQQQSAAQSTHADGSGKSPG